MATVGVRVTLSGAEQVVGGLNAVAAGMKRIEGAALATSARLSRLADSFGRIGNILTLGVTVPIIAAGAAMVKFAADAEEADNLFVVSLGDMSTAALKFTATLERELGLNQTKLKESIGVIFDMTVAMGISRDAAFQMATSLTLLSRDLASFKNLRPEEAFQKIQSGLVGETEPLRRVGVLVDEMTVKTLLLNEGLITETSILTQQQKVLGRFLAIVNQTKTSQGDMARTIDSTQNALRVLSDRTRTAAEQIGALLTPALGAVVGRLNNLIGRVPELITGFKNLDPASRGAAIALVGVAVALGPMLKLLALATRAIAGLLRVFVLLISPVALAIAAIAAVVAATVILIDSQEELGALMGSIWASIVGTVADGALAIIDALSFIDVNGIFEKDFADARANINRNLKLMTRDSAGTAKELRARFGAAFDAIEKNTIGLKDGVVNTFKEQFAAIDQMLTDFVGSNDEAAQGIVDIWDMSATDTVNAYTDAVEKVKAAFGDMASASDKEADKAAKAQARAAATTQRAWESALFGAKTTMVDFTKGVQNLAISARSALANFFTGTLTGAVTFAQGMQQLFAGIADAIIAEFARIAANEVFRVLFGGGGGTAGGRSIGASSSGGSGVLGSLSSGGGLLSNLFGGAGGSGGALAASADAGIVAGGGSTGTVAVGAGGAFAGLGAGLAGGAAGALLGSLLSNAIGGTTGRIVGGLSGALAGALIGFAFGGPVGAVAGGLFGGFGGGGVFARGGEVVATRPSLFLAGEAGPEKIRISPLAGGAGDSGGGTIIFNGPVLFDEITEANFARRLTRAVRSETARIV